MPLPNPTELGPMLISWCFLWDAMHRLWRLLTPFAGEHGALTEGEASAGGTRSVDWRHVLQRVKWPLRFTCCLDPCICLWDPCTFYPLSCPQMIHSCQCPQYLDGVRNSGASEQHLGKLGGHHSPFCPWKKLGLRVSLASSCATREKDNASTSKRKLLTLFNASILEFLAPLEMLQTPS